MLFLPSFGIAGAYLSLTVVAKNWKGWQGHFREDKITVNTSKWTGVGGWGGAYPISNMCGRVRVAGQGFAGSIRPLDSSRESTLSQGRSAKSTQCYRVYNLGWKQNNPVESQPHRGLCADSLRQACQGNIICPGLVSLKDDCSFSRQK